MLKSNDRKIKWIGIALLIFSILFYMAFYIVDGVMLCSDSPGYINMSISREPFYPLFLAYNRWIFGEAVYLDIVVIIQSILAGFAMWKLGDMVYRYSQSKYILTILTIFFQMAVVMLNRIVAMRQATYANEIATEGLTFSLYTLFFAALFQYLKDNKKGDLIAIYIYAALLVSTRKQMLIVYGIFFLAITIRMIFKKITDFTWKKYAILMICILISFAATKGIERIYYFVLQAEVTERTRDSSYLLVNSLYTAKQSDAELFEEGEAKNLFIDMFQQVKEQKLNIDDSGENWKETALHYGNSYDAISYGVAYPTIDNYVLEKYRLKEPEAGRKYDELSKELTNVLLKENWTRVLEVFFVNALMGCVNTVANMKGILIVYALLMYILYVVLWIYSFKKKKDSNGILIGELVFWAIFTNVACVAVTIFSQPRYMIYNMPLFYMAIVWMLYDVTAVFRKDRKNG